MLKLMHDDKIIKEYEDSTIFLILNNDIAELIGSNEFINTPEKVANLHAALAFHWILAHNSELMEKILEEFDNRIVEEIKPAVDTIQ